MSVTQEKFVARPNAAMALVHGVDATTEKLVEDYELGGCRVPRDLWPIVKKYRELSAVVEAEDSPIAEAQANALHDALLVLVAGRK